MKSVKSDSVILSFPLTLQSGNILERDELLTQKFSNHRQIYENFQFLPIPACFQFIRYSLQPYFKLFTQQKNPGNLTVPGYLTFGHNVPYGTQFI